VFYCLGALHNERRDRSILFWKSLPVPDLTTVLSKALVPLLIMPPVVFVVAIATQLIMLAMNAAALSAHGKSTDVLWANVPLGSLSLVLLYGLVTLALWWAPIYAWLLLVGGWARRAPFLWAVLPPLLLGLVEKIAFNTSHVSDLIAYRIAGSFQEAFVVPTKAAIKAAGGFPNGGVPQIDPVKFLSTPGLWEGLVVAAGLLAAAVWSRRYREPI
jgi:ABC-2 type transport system permease protein